MAHDAPDQAERTALAQWVLPFLRHVLVVGEGAEPLVRLLAGEGREVAHAGRLRPGADRPESGLDAAIIVRHADSADDLGAILGQAVHLLGPFGAVYVVTGCGAPAGRSEPVRPARFPPSDRPGR